MKKILSIDISFTCTGWAAQDENGNVESGHKKFVVNKRKRGGLAQNPDIRFAWFRDWIKEMFDLQRPELVVYEETHMQGKAGSEIHHFCYGTVKALCAERDIPCKTVSPLSLKKWATGSGKAEKCDMKRAAVSRFPCYDDELDEGADEADALLMLAWGREL